MSATTDQPDHAAVVAEEDATLDEIVADLGGHRHRDVLRVLVIVARRQAETNERLAAIGAVVDERIPGDLGG